MRQKQAIDEFTEAYNSGVVDALRIVVDQHGEDVIAIDILNCFDEKAIRRIAKRDGLQGIVELIDNYRRLRRSRRA